MNNQEKIAEIQKFLDAEYSTVPSRRVRGWLEFLLSKIEQNTSLMSQATKQLETAQQEIERLKGAVDHMFQNREKWRIAYEDTFVREGKLIEGLQQIREICKDGQAYRIEARVYKVANDLLREVAEE